MNASTSLVVLIFGTLLFTLFAFFMVLFVILQKRRQYQHKLEKQRMEHQYQSELLQSRLEVQEQSFKYFSEEIHDNIGQVLSLVKLQIYKIAKTTTEPAQKEDINTITELMTKAITDLRNLSHTANGTYVLNAELAQIIQKELHYISSARNINCTFSTEGKPYPIDQERKLLIFRIIQKSLSNAIKHGEPDQLHVSLGYTPDRFIVSVSDNGSGFDVNEDRGGDAGLGLNNMSVRADLLKGRFDIQSAKNKGTTIILDIPANV